MTAAPADSVLDSIALVESISADDVEGLAAVLRHCDLAATAAVLDRLMAAELLYSPLQVAFAILDSVGQALRADPSTGNTVITLARELCCRWCDSCVQSGEFREWALSQGHGHD